MIRKIIVISTFMIVAAGCTKLHETFKGDQPDLATSGGTPNIDALLTGVYNSLQTHFPGPGKSVCTFRNDYG